VTGALPDATPLPAQVELAVPAGLKLQWAGELLGGDPSKDPDVSPTVTQKDGLDIYSFTLAKARTGQIEVISPTTFATDAELRTAALEWKSHQDIASLSLYARIPLGSQILKQAEGSGVQPSAEGYSYYGREYKDVKAGETKSLAFAFKPAAVTAAAAAPVAPAAASQGGAGALVPLALLAVAAIAGFFLIRGVNRKMRARQESSGSGADSGSAGSRARGTASDSAADAAAGGTPSRKVSPALLITAAIIGVVVIAGVLASGTTSKVQELPDGFAQEFSQGDECQVLTLKLKEAPSKSTAEKLFGAVAAAQPLRAMIYKQDPRIEVGFCESQTSPEKVQSALAATGLTGEIVPSAP
jgi:hypothetical protein